MLTGIAGLLALRVASPEALVVRYNVATTQDTQRFDPDFRAPDWTALNWSDVAADAAWQRACH